MIVSKDGRGLKSIRSVPISLVINYQNSCTMYAQVECLYTLFFFFFFFSFGMKLSEFLWIFSFYWGINPSHDSICNNLTFVI